MWKAPAVTTIGCSLAVASCLPVPAFAQTNTATRTDTSHALVLVPVLAAVGGGDREPGVSNRVLALPANLNYPAPYRALLQSMLERSPTFRRQCLRLSQAPRLTVILRTLRPNANLAARASSQIVRAGGTLEAIVDVPPVDAVVELIAHELEHVIEQLDGIDLKKHAAFERSGVKAAGNGAFETVRATRIGSRVAMEMREAR